MKDLSKVKNLVVNIDMVKGFCENGALADTYIKRTIPFQIERLEKIKKLNDSQIVFVEECHSKDSEEFKFFPPHCVEGTEECGVVDELKPYEEKAIIFKKNSTSGMTEEFIEFIKQCKDLEKVEIQGCCTDLCVMNFAIPLRNYFNEHNIGVDIVLYEETVETYDAPNHNRDEYNKWAFKFMKQNGIKVKKLGGI